MVILWLMISDRARHELGSATLSHKCKVDLRQDALPFGHWMYLPFTFSVTEVILVQGDLGEVAQVRPSHSFRRRLFGFSLFVVASDSCRGTTALPRRLRLALSLLPRQRLSPARGRARLLGAVSRELVLRKLPVLPNGARAALCQP